MKAAALVQKEDRKRSSLVSFVFLIKAMKCKSGTRKVIHSVKVGIALVLVSLLYLLNPLFEQVGENAMWAIMTVVVIFEFYPGATLCKGINRGIGTLLGAGLGCLVAVLADEIGEIGKPIIVAFSVFAFGGAATYCRMVARLKKSHDYGFMIFILTFNLVAVSGVRADKVVGVAAQRMATIGMGFAVCIFISLLLCPMWASDEFHYSTASNFTKLATNIQGCLDEYFKTACEKENYKATGDDGAYIQACKSILNSKSNDDSLANYAKWEPWHGKFGFNYPWDKYLEVGQHLRELAAALLSLQGCLQSPKQPPPIRRQSVKEPCEIFILSIVEILRELGESIEKMEKCEANKVVITPKLLKLDLTPLCNSKVELSDSNINNENLVVATFTFLLTEIAEKVQILGKKVELLGESANFKPRKIDV